MKWSNGNAVVNGLAELKKHAYAISRDRVGYVLWFLSSFRVNVHTVTHSSRMFRPEETGNAIR